MIRFSQKIELGVLLAIVGGLCTAGVKAIQTEYRVDEHESKINSMTDKINQISSDTSFIRGKLENMKTK